MAAQSRPQLTPLGFGSLAVRSGLPHDASTGSLSESICLATTFAQRDIGQPIGPYVYSRSNNPNRESFEIAVATLEKAKYAISFSSGLAATVTIMQGFASNGHIISIADLYGGTYRYLTRVAEAHGVSATFTTAIEGDMESLIQNNTKLIWIESPSNPTLSLVDIKIVTQVAHKHGVLVVVDNTLLSPYLQNPLEFDADLVLHSVTMSINGHSDVLMGVVAFNSDDIKQKLSFLQNAIGSVPSPFDCWLAHRGIKTLHLRMQAASENASALAAILDASPHVQLVYYPGLSSHPHHQLALKQHRAGMGGAMISFRIRGGGSAAARFCKETKMFTLAESLGGVESLCEIPAKMTHAAMPREAREKAGVFDDLIRLSIGVEDLEDLKADLLSALEQAAEINTGIHIPIDS